MNDSHTSPNKGLTNFKLLTGETLLAVENFPVVIQEKPPSSLSELYRLARAKTHNEVGSFGPVMAAIDHKNAPSTSQDFHLYEALFGRDSLRVASDLMTLFPRLAHTTLLTLAENQGFEFDNASEEEPGRIPHEIRSPKDPIAQQITARLGWKWPYYGSVDVTPQFIKTLSQYCQISSEKYGFLFQDFVAKSGESRLIVDALSSAVNWITRRIDTNPDGLIESRHATPSGIVNQSWKDSPDSHFHADGTWANPDAGIASVEVQCLAHDALLAAAELYESVLGRVTEAAELKSRAETLRKTILDLFWTDSRSGFFVIGTDRATPKSTPRKMEIRTSNMGHVLNSQALGQDDPRVAKIIAQLFSPEMLAASGIRTLASDEIRFRPGAYHNGSVWLWDNYYIVRGLQRHGYFHLAHELSERLFRIIEQTRTYPEYVRGDFSQSISLNTQIIDVWDSVHNLRNRVEQPPQNVQAWSVAAVIAIKHHRQSSIPYNRRFLSKFEAEIWSRVKSNSA